MRNIDPLERFEELAARLCADAAPSLSVAGQVMRRVRAAEAASERTLTLLAAGCCIAAAAVLVVGFTQLSGLSESTGPLEALFQMVPPVGF